MLAKQVTGQAGVSADTALQFAKGAINESQTLLTAAKIAPGERGVAATQNDGLAPALRKYANAYVALENQKRAADKATDDAKKAAAAQAQQHQQATAGQGRRDPQGAGRLAARQRDLEGLQQAQKQALTEVGTNTSTQLNQLNEQVTSAQGQHHGPEPGEEGPSGPEQDPHEQGGRLPARPARQHGPPAGRGHQRDPGRRTCYINIGQARGVPVGTTFMVYDKVGGIPSLSADIEGLDDESARRQKDATSKLSTAAAGGGGIVTAAAANDRYETGMPAGFKASIEVTRVMPGNTAQCKIIKVERGQQLQVGDIIGNVVFNPDVKFKFAVYGEFDLDYNGVPTTTDTSTVKRLITQWGGQISQPTTAAEIGPDIDFVVVGIRPEVPVLTADDANNAIEQQRVEAAKVAQQKYNDILDRARDFSIPVLNQTRFLYYTGYFDQRTR
jgi:hypothetical protein